MWSMTRYRPRRPYPFTELDVRGEGNMMSVCKMPAEDFVSRRLKGVCSRTVLVAIRSAWAEHPEHQLSKAVSRVLGFGFQLDLSSAV